MGMATNSPNQYLSVGPTQHIEKITPHAFTAQSGVDRYGFLYLAQNTLKLNFKPRYFGDWQHGWVWWDDCLPIDILGPSYKLYDKDMPIVTTSDKEKQAFLSRGYQNVKSGGLPIIYTDNFQFPKKNKTLIAFLSHSAEAVAVDVLDNRYLDYLESIQKDWEHIYVSIFSLDWNEKIVMEVLRRGLIPLYGANPLDRNSLNRTKHNLMAAEFVSSNSMGSHIAYALSLGCKVSLFKDLYRYDPSRFIGPDGYSSEEAERFLSFNEFDYISTKYPQLFSDDLSSGWQDISKGDIFIGKHHKFNADELTQALGWGVKGQLSGYGRFLKRTSKQLLKTIFNSQTHALNTSIAPIDNINHATKLIQNHHGALFFIDTIPHLRKAKLIEEQYSFNECIYVTNNLDIYSKLDSDKSIFFQNKLSLIHQLNKLDKRYFNKVIVARVDWIDFQLAYKLFQFEELHTFDEGLYSIEPTSIYNSQDKITLEAGLKSYISSRIFSLPMPVASLLQQSHLHYTWFDFKHFNGTYISSAKLVSCDDLFNEIPIDRVFIGQPWHFMNIDSKAVKAIASFINKNGISLYLSHPREELTRISHLFDEHVSVVQTATPGEYFLNQMSVTCQPEIFTVASSIVTHIPIETEVSIVCSELFGKNAANSQENLIDVIKVSGRPYKIFNIDSSPESMPETN